MRTDDLTENERHSLDNVAFLVYQAKNGGISGVFALAKLLGWEEYGPCDPCEYDNSPMLANACMICGTPTTPE